MFNCVENLPVTVRAHPAHIVSLIGQNWTSTSHHRQIIQDWSFSLKKDILHNGTDVSKILNRHLIITYFRKHDFIAKRLHRHTKIPTKHITVYIYSVQLLQVWRGVPHSRAGTFKITRLGFVKDVFEPGGVNPPKEGVKVRWVEILCHYYLLQVRT